MAETVIVATVRVLVEKLVGVAAEGIGGVLGVKNELNKLKKSLDRMKAFLSDADRRQVEETTVRLWLKNLEEVIYEVDNLLDEYNYEILRRKVEIRNQLRRKVCFFFSFSNPFLFRVIIAHKIKDVNMKLEKLDEEADRHGIRKGIVDSAFFVPPVIETDSISVDPIFLGRENDVSDIVNMLLLKRILEILTKGDVQVECQEDILQDLQKKLAEGRYLLVLDDLWNDKYWENFRRALLGINSKRGNFIIVTTRSKEVASIVGPKYQYSLNKLSDSDCLDIIKKRAFCEGDEVSVDLEPIVRKIACKCGGLPLAANIIGGTLQRIGKDEWGSVSESELLDSNEDAIGVLKVSFDRLPSPLLKKCFAYCSILRKDAEIEKERLIQLWMAEGLLAETDSSDMESLGNRVYDTLLQNFFFQEEVKDEYGNIKHSKMHDLLHDLACLISTAETFNMENPKTESPGDQVKYVVMKSHVDQEPLGLIRQNLAIMRAFVLGSKVHDLFNDCKYLRVLDLQQTDIEELTTSIAKLIHFRFLDVSFTKIRAFPKSLCKLYNLQTLRAIRCNNLTQLPRQLQNLLNLRHFIVENAFFTAFQMPLEIGKLTCLRTLKFFNVGQENGHRIEELENLRHLKGELEIRNLEHVNDQEAAARAGLVRKPNIHKLVLVWSESREDKPHNDGEVLEGLEPHPNIKSLTIKRFSGEKFSLWMMNRSVGDARRLDKLIELKLIDCERCQEIPTLGHLPRLKILELVGFKNVKSIGMSFYYPHGGFDESSSTESGCSQLQAVVLFGALETFRLHNMPKLVEWTDISTNSATRVVNAFPRLESLDISECPNLCSAPSHGFPSLKELSISDAEKGSVLLNQICDSIYNLSSLTSLELRRVSDLIRLPKKLFCKEGPALLSLKIMECRSLSYLELRGHDHACNANLQRLERLYIIDCANLASIRYPMEQSESQSGGLSSLRDLRILNCNTLTNIPSTMLESSTSLGYLMVSNCAKLTSLTVDFERMPNLYYLQVSHCYNLRRVFPIVRSNCVCHLTQLTLGSLAKDASPQDFYRDFESISSLKSLQDLTLGGNRMWKSLPDQLQRLTALTHLSLSYFGVEELPEWFGDFSYLRTLSLQDMESLGCLPRTMESLTRLEDLYINGCKLIYKWKRRGSAGYVGIYDDPTFRRFRQVLNVYANGMVMNSIISFISK
ncbi:UNVERIFIED_CONTAM: Disease resistance protein RGA2 [Sesamum radiatum]|uniref:Disease resistance protein RGA2 n=1 Tax=Sesamum radiatum TaxID=300843 RepID=A0AAW2R3K3_SESRA